MIFAGSSGFSLHSQAFNALKAPPAKRCAQKVSFV
jgi:hypothetical protein